MDKILVNPLYHIQRSSILKRYVRTREASELSLVSIRA